MKNINAVKCSLFAALICVCSCVAVPVGAVPVSLSLIAIIMTGLLMGVKCALASTFVYILLGAFGLPVFSGFMGGINVLLGPTGGYIWSYLVVALFSGYAKNVRLKIILVPMIYFAVLVCYFFGTLQFSFVQNVSFTSAMTICVYPFVLIDILKVFAAVYLSGMLSRRVNFN